MNSFGKGEYDRAVADHTKTIELAPKWGQPYFSRAQAYVKLKQYDKAWADVDRCRTLGFPVEAGLLETLSKESGRKAEAATP
jgi:tetratricopeptide (TPR) repeat protein